MWSGNGHYQSTFQVQQTPIWRGQLFKILLQRVQANPGHAKISKSTEGSAEIHSLSNITATLRLAALLYSNQNYFPSKSIKRVIERVKETAESLPNGGGSGEPHSMRGVSPVSRRRANFFGPSPPANLVGIEGEACSDKWRLSCDHQTGVVSCHLFARIRERIPRLL